MFEGNDLNHAMGIPFFYGICEAFFVGAYCVGAWKAGWSKAPSDATFWKVLFTTYEVLEKQSTDDEIEITMTSESSGNETYDGNIFTTFFIYEDTNKSKPKEASGNEQVEPPL